MFDELRTLPVKLTRCQQPRGVTAVYPGNGATYIDVEWPEFCQERDKHGTPILATTIYLGKSEERKQPPFRTRGR